MLPLPVCERIVSHVSVHRRHDLHALLLTNKTFHAAAEPIIYAYNVFTDVRRIHLFTHTLTKLNPRLALHVHTFGINLHDFVSRTNSTTITTTTAGYHAALVQVTQHEFWDDIRVALRLMERLKTLVLVEMAVHPGIAACWTRILDVETPYTFVLEEVKLHLAVDDRVVRFVNSQAGGLRVVRLYNTTSDEEDGGEGISEELVLPNIETLDISLALAPHIHPQSLLNLTHLQLFFDSPTNNTPPHLPTLLSTLLTPSHPRLRGLSLLELPPHLSTTHLFQHIAKLTSTTLCHLSHLHLPAPYPSQADAKAQFLACLIEFPRLCSIELSLDSWDHKNTSPASNIGPGIRSTSHQTDTTPTSQLHLPNAISQKALISELKTFCPTLHTIVLWYGKVRMRWAFIGDDLPIQVQTSAAGKRLDGGGGGGSGNIENEITTTKSALCRHVENRAVSGEWHYRVEDDQWAGYSRLWRTC